MVKKYQDLRITQRFFVSSIYELLKPLGKQIFLLMLFLISFQKEAASLSCHPLLWPEDSALVDTSIPVSKEWVLRLKKWSKKILSEPQHPLAQLGSAGKTSIHDATLIASRKAFQDADRAAILAIIYRLTKEPIYLIKTKDILISWSEINHPTGNPIDETRLDGFIWAYDLISCHLSVAEKNQILDWFERMRLKKIAWKFGLRTRFNNHRIHQLKMLLLLDKVLQLDDEWIKDIKAMQMYATINLNKDSGVSIDYIERSALYYHNYVLQPWLEMNLITGQCGLPIQKAFSFLSNKILSHDTGHEFSDSQAKIDILRAKGGFKYAQKGSEFDINKAASTIVAYYTMVHTSPDPKLWYLQKQNSSSLKMKFLKIRRALWTPKNTPYQDNMSPIF